MELIDHAIIWCKGEIFEGKLSLLFGLIILLVSLTYWKFGTTPYAKAIFLPLVVVAFLAVAAGIYLITNNQSRITSFQESYSQNSKQFIQAEKERTEDFIVWYPYTRYIMAGLTVIAMALIIFVDSAVWKSIGISLMLLTLYAFVLDHFSEERAITYYQEIQKVSVKTDK